MSDPHYSQKNLKSPRAHRSPISRGSTEEGKTEKFKFSKAMVSSKWKFNFKKAILVEDSDIGPINSKMTLLDIKNFIIKNLLIFLTRLQTIFLLFLIVISYLSSSSELYTGLNRISYVVILLGSLACQILFQIYFFFQVKKMENNWNKCKIEKLKKSTGKLVTVEIKELNIGDLVFVKNSVICPADVLVVATSDVRHGDCIFHSNERRIDGQDVFYTKRAVRNIVQANSKSMSLKVADTFSKIQKGLSGYVEYDSPHSNINFQGLFKLNNDPKVSKFNAKNVLFAGSKLCSSWVFGIVIYNGRNTKILQRYKDHLSGKKSLKYKKPKIAKDTNRIILFMWTILIVQTLLSYIISVSSEQHRSTTRYIEEFFNISTINRISDLILSYSWGVPLASFIIMDISSFIYGYKIENKFMKLNYPGRDDSSDRKENKKLSSLSGERDSTSGGKDNIKKRHEKHIISIQPKNELNSFKFASIAKGIGGSEKQIMRNNLALPNNNIKITSLQKGSVDKPLNSENSQKTPDQHIRKKLSYRFKTRNEFMFGVFKEKKVKIIDHRILPDLGDIDHVIFDKTDTLTKSSIDVKSIATVKRIYEIDTNTIISDLKLVQKDPERFKVRDEKDDKFALEEVERYSEKSQEFERELDGEFIPEVFDEDRSLLDELKRSSMKFKEEMEKGKQKEEIQENGLLDKSGRKRSRFAEKVDTNNFLSVAEGAIRTLSNLDNSEERINTGKTEDFFDLNLEELEREVRSKFQKLGMMSMNTPRNVVRRSNRLKSRTFFKGSSHKIGEDEQKIFTKVDKEKKQTEMLADVYHRQSDLVELIKAISVCHEARKVEGSRSLRSHNNQEKAILTLLKRVGLELETYNDEKTDTLNFKFRYQGLKYYELSLVGINTFSKSRGRISVLVYNKKSDNFILYAKGEDYTMRSIMNLSAKDKIVYKQLMMNIRVKGLKRIVVAKKILNKMEYKSFLTNFRVISKMKRNQEENFENLALEYEKDMTFVGCLGVKNVIEDSVKNLISSLLEAEFKVSMFTGDILENTILAAKELNLSEADFNDTSSYYSLRFKSEGEGLNQIRRILEYLYENLKIESVFDPKLSNKIIDKNLLRRRSIRYHKDSEIQSSKSELEENKNEKKDLQKTLLINGTTVDLIMRNVHLSSHFKLILSFCKNILGYSMNGEHKAFLTACLKETSNSVVLACGDGFNDMPMLKEANIGVQLSNKDVPLIFGDIVVTSVNSLRYLIFVRGKNIFENMNIFNILFLLYFPVTIMNLFYTNGVTLYSGRFFDSWVFYLAYFWLSPALIALVTTNSTFNSFLIDKFPVVYQERRSLKNNLLVIYAICIFTNLVESITTFMCHYLINRTKTDLNGYISSNTTTLFSFIIPSFVNCFFKLYFFANRVNPIFYYINFGAIGVIFIFALVALGGSSNVMEISIPVKEALMRGDTYLSFIISMGIPAMVNWVFIVFMKKNIISPIFYESCNQINTGNYNFFEQKSLVTPRTYVPKKKAEDLSLKIKRIFKSTTFMDDLVKKIMSLEDSVYTFGVNRTTCSIIDNAESKRYNIYKRSWENDYYKTFFSIFLIISFLEFIFVLASTTKSYNYFFDTQYPYQFLIMLIPLACVFIKNKQRDVEKYSHIMIIIFLITITILKLVFGEDLFFTSSFAIVRLLQGPAHIEYIFSVIGIGYYVILTAIQILIFPSYNEYVIDNFFKFELIVITLLVGATGIIFKQKIDLNVKLNFLAKVRIKKEVSASDEKLRMLMPQFVLSKMNNFEMTGNFLADDAGEVTILFCDICQFDTVMKEAQSSVIQILDDVFRYFDFLCKQYGVQKIETVGKTYMACGGLKFLEEKLTDEQKNSSANKRMVDVAIDMMNYIDTFTYGKGKKLNLKIGVHYGNCIYGVLGYHKPQFSLIGDTVNTTSRCCTTGPDGKIILSEQAYQALVKTGEESQLEFFTRMAKMKGKGLKKTYIVERTPIKEDEKRGSFHPNLLIKNEEIMKKMKQGSRKSSSINEFSMQNFEAVNKILDDEEKMGNSLEFEIDEMQSDDGEEGIELEDYESIIEQEDNEEQKDRDRKGSQEENEGKLENQLTKKETKRRRKNLLAGMANNDLFNLNSRINIMNPFNTNKNSKQRSNLSKNFEKHFITKMTRKNQNKIFASVLILMIQSLVHLLASLLDIENDGIFWPAAIMEIINVITLVLFISFTRSSAFSNFPFLPKMFLAGIFLLRYLSRIFEIWSFVDKRKKRERLYIHLIFCFIIDSGVINSTGIFYFFEAFCYNAGVVITSILTLLFKKTDYITYKIFCILAISVFNLTDNFVSFTRDLSSVNNLILIEKKSLQLSQFVDRLLPKHIQQTVNEPGQNIGDYYKNVTLLYADIVGFTNFSNKNSARQVVAMLSSLFTDFDKECNRLGLFKIYTIGDCYVVMSFLDKNNRRDIKEEANAVAQMGISMIRIINRVRKKLRIDLNMRIGIHTGDIYGGVIGTDIVRFDLYGSDVVIANKMESKGTPGMINVSEKTKRLLEGLDTMEYSFEENKVVDLESLDLSIKCYYMNYEKGEEDKMIEL